MGFPSRFNPVLGVVILVAALGTLGPLSGCIRRYARPDNLLLVTVDTLRADRLGCYGRDPSLTPNLDRLASEGVLLEQVIVPIPRTTQSIASLMTGLHPVRHGARGLFSTLPESGGPTLAELLTEEGFESVAFTSNLVLRGGQGFERGFSLYDDPPARWVENGGRDSVEDALDWIETKAPDRWFLWLHILDPHWPYEPPPPFDAPAGGITEEDVALFRGDLSAGPAHQDRVFGGFDDPSRLAHLTLLYDGETASTDAVIGSLVEGLNRLGQLEDTLVVVTSDHGEALGEHGYYFAHGEYLYEDSLRVPALMRSPGLIPAGRRLRRLVRLHDLMPTMLDLLAVEIPAGLDGVSRHAEILGEEENDIEREIYMESDRDLLRPGNPKRFLPGYAGSWRGLRGEGWKVIRVPRPGGDLWEAYDLRSDPDEAHRLDPADLPGGEEILARLADWESRAEEADRPASGLPLDPAQEEALRSLGYLPSSGGEGGR
jgi:arylsulfatase A-like enzyme